MDISDIKRRLKTPVNLVDSDIPYFFHQCILDKTKNGLVYYAMLKDMRKGANNMLRVKLEEIS